MAAGKGESSVLPNAPSFTNEGGQARRGRGTSSVEPFELLTGTRGEKPQWNIENNYMEHLFIPTPREAPWASDRIRFLLVLQLLSRKRRGENGAKSAGQSVGQGGHPYKPFAT